MPKFSVTRKVPYSADQVFAISMDVAQYRQFVPLVRRSVVRDRARMADGRETFEADLVVSYKKLNIEETLTSKVIVDPAQRLVTAQSTEGPVKYLNSEWRIAEAGQGYSEIQLTVDYALKSRALQFVLSGMFDMIVRRVLTAFEERAKFLYGSKAAIS